jgi:hypothetical protein
VLPSNFHGDNRFEGEDSKLSSKVMLAVSKVRLFPHLLPLRHCHDINDNLESSPSNLLSPWKFDGNTDGQFIKTITSCGDITAYIILSIMWQCTSIHMITLEWR